MMRIFGTGRVLAKREYNNNIILLYNECGHGNSTAAAAADAGPFRLKIVNYTHTET